MILLEIADPISNWVPIVISSIGLFVSVVTAYFSNFKRSKPNVLIGSRISLYNVPFQGPDGLEWGSTGFLIPMTFFNWSPNGGSIIESRITISRIDNSNEVFDVRWTEFTEMLLDERRMGNAGFAQPIPLPPKSSITKTVLFVWHYFNDKNLRMEYGRYALNVLFWTKSSTKPNLSQSFEFLMTEELADTFNFYFLNKSPLTIDISIREINRNNSILTKNEGKQLYGIK